MNQISAGVKYSWILASSEAYHGGFSEIEPEHFYLGILKLFDIRNDLTGNFDNISQPEIDEIQKEISQPLNVLLKYIKDITVYRRTLRIILIKGEPKQGMKEIHRSQISKSVFDKLQNTILASGIINISSLLAELITLGRWQIRESLLSGNVNIEQLLKEIQLQGQSNPLHTSGVPDTPGFGRNLNTLAREGKLNPVIGREMEIIELGRVLMQKTKSNAILIGDAGVGKTAIVEGLALAIVRGNVPEQLKNKTIIEVNIAEVIAGTKYRGEFEEKLQKIIDDFIRNTDHILFIDEVHTLIGAGATGGPMDASNILKPVLARGEIRFIGATTIDEYRKYIEKDPALQRRMQTIRVEEPTLQSCRQILKKISLGYQQYYGVTISEGAIQKAIDLSVTYLPDQRLPDKAIDILESACSSKLFPSRFFSGSAGAPVSREIDDEDIIKIIARKSGIPVENLKVNRSDKIIHIDKFLSDRIIGQNEAVKAISETIKISKAGFKDINKPVAVFLFCGPTGVGKTETAKLLAEFLSGDQKKLVRFDMSEYMEKHEISKLIGAPPGYVGYEEEGQLIRKMRSNPGAVVLFDEIEKAHPDINNIFLQIFDEGIVTGSNGKSAFFNQSVIILTSNLGANIKAETRKTPLGFKPDERSGIQPDPPGEAMILASVRKHFSPELISRIQQIIIFKPLDMPAVDKIIDQHIDKINNNLKDRNIRIILSDSTRIHIAGLARASEYGARNISHTIDSLILTRLSKMILEENISDRTIQVDFDKNRLEISG